MVASNRPSPRRGRAFSLVEMLVVIGILAILISLLLPAIGRARKQANTVTCASNLAQIHRAMMQWKAEQPYAAFPASGWKAAYMKYVANNAKLYLCPEEESSSPLAPSTYDFADLAIRVKRPPEYWDIPLAPGPRALLNNQTASSFELWFEEQKPTENDPEHVDFDDLKLKITTNSDGTVTLTVISTKYSTDSMYLYDVTSDKMIWDRLPNQSTGGETLKTDNFSHYAFNQYVNEIEGDAEKIAALDYVTSTMKPDGPSDNWSTNVTRFQDVKGRLRFARHSNQANAMYGDGSVRLTPIALRNDYDMNGPWDREEVSKRWMPRNP
jgi:prepilin-type N-terminal cleavage/methylation domain-containing protein/prepilin-type processing-associated H-X9-DG protein